MQQVQAAIKEVPLHGCLMMTNEQYHSAPGISCSKLHAVAVSELNYWDQYVNPEREPEDYKHCFAVGDGTHKLVLEPGTFEHTYAVGFDKNAYPDALDTSADLKKELAANGLMVSGTKPELAERLINEAGFPENRIMLKLLEAHNKTMEGRIPIPATDYRDMMGMLKQINTEPVASKLLEGAMTEQSYFVIDENGILRKCRTDLVTFNGNIVGDVKTTDDVSAQAFGWTIAKRRYHVQAAWYLDILKMLYGSDAPEHFAFIAVQKKRPYDVAVHYLTPEQIEIGRRIYKEDLARLIQADASGYYPGVARGKYIQAELPYREMHRFDEI